MEERGDTPPSHSSAVSGAALPALLPPPSSSPGTTIPTPLHQRLRLEATPLHRGSQVLQRKREAATATSQSSTVTPPSKCWRLASPAVDTSRKLELEDALPEVASGSTALIAVGGHGIIGDSQWERGVVQPLPSPPVYVAEGMHIPLWPQDQEEEGEGQWQQWQEEGQPRQQWQEGGHPPPGQWQQWQEDRQSPQGHQWQQQQPSATSPPSHNDASPPAVTHDDLNAMWLELQAACQDVATRTDAALHTAEEAKAVAHATQSQSQAVLEAIQAHRAALEESRSAAHITHKHAMEAQAIATEARKEVTHQAAEVKTLSRMVQTLTAIHELSQPMDRDQEQDQGKTSQAQQAPQATQTTPAKSATPPPQVQARHITIIDSLIHRVEQLEQESEQQRRWTEQLMAEKKMMEEQSRRTEAAIAQALQQDRQAREALRLEAAQAFQHVRQEVLGIRKAIETVQQHVVILRTSGMAAVLQPTPGGNASANNQPASHYNHPPMSVPSAHSTQAPSTQSEFTSVSGPQSTVRSELRLRRSRSQPMQPATSIAHQPIIIGQVPQQMPAVHTSQLREVTIAPVHAAPAAQPSIVPTAASAAAFLPAAVAQAMTGKEPGRFSGVAAEWALWRRRWMLYLEEVQQVLPAMTGRQKLTVLRHWLDSASAEYLDSELQADPELQYDAYWARLDLSFGAEDKEGIRRQLKQLKLQTRGRVTEQEWRAFAARLTLLARQLNDISDIEVGRLMQDALPTHPWRRKLAEEAEKKSHAGVLVMEGVPTGTTAAEIEQLIQLEAGVKPQRVVQDGQKFRLYTTSPTDREIIKMTFDRQQLHQGSLITINPDAVELSGTEVQALMLRWLRIDSRITASSVNSPGRDTDTSSAGRFPRRFHREVTAEDDDEDDSFTEATTAEVRGRPAKRPASSPAPSAASVAPQSTSPPSTPAAAEQPAAKLQAAPPAAEQWPGRGLSQGPPNARWQPRGSSWSWNVKGGKGQGKGGWQPWDEKGKGRVKGGPHNQQSQ